MTTVSQLSPAGLREDVAEGKRRSAIWGAVISEFIDMFDIYLPTVVLSPVLFVFQPAKLPPGTEAIAASLVFITTLVGRPIGALVFGLVADHVGRRAASIWSVAGFGLVTLLIALLPGYDTLGIGSYWLLVLLRFVDGICLGGGYTGAIPLAMEYSRKEERGLVGALILAAFPAAYVAITLVAIAMFALFPLAGPGSPYAEIGWRIPFVIGALLAGVLALYYVFKVSESQIWEAETGAKKKQPLAELLRGRGGRDLLQVLLMLTGFWLTQNLMTIFIPTTLLPRFLHLGRYELTATLLICFTVLIGSYIVSGLIGQRIGRRRFFITVGPVIATVGAGLLYVLCTAEGLPLPAVVGLTCLMMVVVTSPWAIIVTYVNERFATDVRATGFGIGYSLSVIIPSFYAFYMNWLGALMPFRTTAVALLAVGGLIATLGAALGPETRDVDF